MSDEYSDSLEGETLEGSTPVEEFELNPNVEKLNPEDCESCSA